MSNECKATGNTKPRGGDTLVLEKVDVDLLAEDWSTLHEWFTILERAEAEPAKFVLRTRGWRIAAPQAIAVSLAVRCALLTHIANIAVRQLGAHEQLERINVWPSAPARRVPYLLSSTVAKVLNLIEWFSAEDEETLRALMRACRRELQTFDVQGAAGKIAREHLERYLWEAEQKAFAVLKACSLARAPAA